MKNNQGFEDFFPGINEYLEKISGPNSISSKGLEELVLQVRARTGLSTDVCSAIVSYFFQEVQNAILRGETVTLRGLGKFLVSSPRTSTTKERVFVKFTPYKSLIRKMNNGRK